MICQLLQPPPRRRLRQNQRGRDLLVDHASGCHLFAGKEFLYLQDHSCCQNAQKHLGFESNDAAVHGYSVNVQKPAVSSQKFYSGWVTFHQKEPKREKVNICFGPPLLQTSISLEKLYSYPQKCLKHRKTQPKNAKGSEQTGHPVCLISR